MTKNAIIFVLASLGILVGWEFAMSKFYPAKDKPAVAEPRTPGASAPATASAAPAAAPASSSAPVMAKASGGPAMKAAPLPIKLQTEVFNIELSTWGARLTRLELKGVTHKDKEGKDAPLDLVTGADSPRYAGLELGGLDLDQAIWTLLTPKPEKLADGERVRFGLKAANGLQLEKSFLFRPKGQRFEIKVKAVNVGKLPLSLGGLGLLWGPNLGGENLGIGMFPPSGVVQLEGRIERERADGDAGSKTYSAPRWVALKNHYFVLGYFPAPGSGWNRAEIRQLGGEKVLTALQVEGKSLQPGESLELAAEAYAGAQEYDALKAEGGNFQAVVQFQYYQLFDWLNPLCILLLHIMKWFHQVTGNWGVAIILLTLLVRGVLFWPSLKSMVSMRRMQTKMAQMQPRLETLKKVYKDDPSKMNQETMKLYKEYGVNPLGGCLPMLLQIPVFFALYGTLSAAFELRGADFMWKWTDLTAGDPTYIFPIAMGVSMFFQQKLAPMSATMSEEQQQMQKMMLWMMPIMFTGMALFMHWPMGLLLYWTASNAFGIAQQLVVNKTVD